MASKSAKSATRRRDRLRARPAEPPAPGKERPAPRAPAILVLAVFAAVFSTLGVVGYSQQSATWDEPIHLATGYAALAQRDYRVDSTHPPFMRMWAALPLLAMPDVRLDTSEIDRTPPVDWVSGSTAYDFSTRFLYVENDADRLLNAARFMILIWGVVLGILLFCWTNEWLGFGPAVCALIFYTLSPNLLAHASLVTTDGGISCLIFGAIYFLWRTCRRVTALNLAGLTMFFALAIVTKFSGLILGPLALLLLFVAVSQRSVVTGKVAAGVMVILCVASVAAVWAVHGFQYVPSRSPSWLLHLENTELAQRTVPGIAQVTAWIDSYHLLPNAFTQGFLMFAQSMEPPNSTFLFGAFSDEGWWYYFPVAFLIKTPIALIVLMSAGLFVCVRRWRGLGLTEIFVVLPIGVYLGAAMMSQHQVGLRHILPIYPFVLLVAAMASKELIDRPVGRGVLAVLTMFWLATVASVYPNTLTFFNRLVGGPRNGYKYLVDSNLDWGQGLKLLDRWMARQGVTDIGLAYFGTADPTYYGIDYKALPATPSFVLDSIARPPEKPTLPGYVAVSATVLSGVFHDPQWRLFYRGLHDKEPVAEVGNSILVYWLDRWPEPDEATPPATLREIEAHRVLAGALLSQQWFDHAAVHYRKYLGLRPDDAGALDALGLALLGTGATDEAISAFQRAVALAPEDGSIQLNLALTLFDGRREITEVLAQARRAVVLRPSDPVALVLLARALAVNGEWIEAGALAERAVQIDPSDTDARELLAQIRAVVG